ncbi:MAG: hypothetical protein KF716_01385 [Anaerolineae bacterium]|nr:hypothetical protein [Anaerolineae bacterium]
MLARFDFRQSPNLTMILNVVAVLVIGALMGGLTLIHPLLSFVAIIGVILTYVSLVYPLFLAYVLIFATITTSGMLRGSIIPMLKPNEAVLALTGAVSFVVIMLRRPPQIANTRVFIGMLILVFGTTFIPILAYYARGWRFTMSELFNLLAPAQYLLLFWIFSYLPETDTERRQLVQFMLLCATLLGFVGLLQVAKIGGVQGFLERWYPGDQTDQAATLNRVTTLFGAWNATGTFLMIVMLLIIALQAIKHPLWMRLNMYIALGVCGACLLASGSFAGIGGLAAGIVMVKFLDRRGMRALLNLGIAMLIAALLLSPIIIQRLQYQFGDGGATNSAVPQTFAYRLTIWQNIYIPALMKSNPWFGLVPTMENLSWQWAESQYIFLLMRSGIVSLVAHLAWVGIMCAWLWNRMRTTTGQTKIIANVTLCCLIILSVMGFTNEVFTLSGAIDYIWIFLGLVANAGVNPIAEPE